MRSLKILEVAGSGTVGTAQMGPVSRVIFELSKELAAIGHDVTVADTPAQDRSRMPSVMELDAPARRTSGDRDSEQRFVAELLRHDLASFDIVHTHEWQTSYHLHRHGIRTVYTAHTPMWTGYKGVRRLADRLQQAMVPHESQVIRESLMTVALGPYLKVKGANIVVIPSGIRLEDWRPVQPRRHGFTVLYVGRLVPIKGAHVLIQALRQLDFDFRAVVIGCPEDHAGAYHQTSRYAERLKARAAHLPVTFTGFLNNRSDRFREYLAGADILVVPSLFDAQGLVVLEALAMGIPVIGSDVGGVGMMLTADVGRLVRPADPRALAEAIGELHADPQLRQAMSSRTREHVARQFNWRRCAEAYSAAMQRCLESS